jgi:hypothetical protein
VPTPSVRFEGGPRHEELDWIDRPAVTIGDGSDGGVYHRTNATEGGVTLYRWQELTDAEAAALVRGDLRANEHP